MSRSDSGQVSQTQTWSVMIGNSSGMRGVVFDAFGEICSACARVQFAVYAELGSNTAFVDAAPPPGWGVSAGMEVPFHDPRGSSVPGAAASGPWAPTTIAPARSATDALFVNRFICSP